jgi:poly(A) polymerase Pap1
VASKVKNVEITDDAVIVTVVHTGRDSFSRSVNRAARASWRKTIRGNDHLTRNTVYSSAKYAHTRADEGHPRWDDLWESTIVYTDSWDNGEAILDQRLNPFRNGEVVA